MATATAGAYRRGVTTSNALRAAKPVTGAVGDQMIRRPKTVPSGATVGRVREAFDNDHVHLVLLTDGPQLRGTVTREDVRATPDHIAALSVARLDGRTVGPAGLLADVHQMLIETDTRRLAVVDDDGVLLGLLCLKRRRTGFCGEADLDARRASAAALTSA